MTALDLASSDPLINRTIEGYQILKRLGEGSYGIVYLARHPRIRERLVAIKYFQVENPAEVKTVEREVEVLARLQHPNIVDVYDTYLFDRYQLIVMELIRGGSLLNALKRLQRPLDLRLAVYLIEQVAFALGHIHAQNILHLDLKPGNILLDPIGEGQGARPLLTDFGIARIVNPGSMISSNILGTPIYMSPEHFGFGDTRPDSRSDIYSLGVMLYELVVGKVPFHSSELLDILNLHAYSPVPLPSQRVPGLPPELDVLLLRALAKLPEERFQSANEMGSALRELRLGKLAQFPVDPDLATERDLGAVAQANAEVMANVSAQYPAEEPVAFSLLVMRPDGEKQSVSFKKQSIVIGRDQAADLQLDHPSISRRHAQIDCDNKGNLFVTDLQSINGTFLDGVRLSAQERMLWKNTQYLLIQGHLLQIDGLPAAEGTVDPFVFTTAQVVVLLEELQKQQAKPSVRTTLSPAIVYLEPGKEQYVQFQVTPENVSLARYDVRAKPGPGVDESWYTLPAGHVIPADETYTFDFVISAPSVGTQGGKTHEIALEVVADQPGIPSGVQVLKLRIVPLTRFSIALRPNEVSHNRRRRTELVILNSGNQTETFSIEAASPDTLRIEPSASQIAIEPLQERAVRLKFKAARGAQKGRRRLLYTLSVQSTSGVVERVNGSYVFSYGQRVPIWLLILWVLVVIVMARHFVFGVSIGEQFAEVRAFVEFLVQLITGA